MLLTNQQQQSQQQQHQSLQQQHKNLKQQHQQQQHPSLRQHHCLQQQRSLFLKAKGWFATLMPSRFTGQEGQALIFMILTLISVPTSAMDMEP